MKAIFHALKQRVDQQQRVALATVISSKGSLPMSRRAKMVVFQHGETEGTVGGGMLEATVIQEARQTLESGMPRIIKVDLTSDQIEADGLTCGGVVEILLEVFTPDDNLAPLHEILQLYEEEQVAITATPLNLEAYQPGRVLCRKLIIRSDGTMTGSLHPTLDARIAAAVSARRESPCLEILTLPLSDEEAQLLGISPQTDLRLFLESLAPPPTAFLFGGGHISQHLSQILPLIGFEFVVIDDRKEFANSTRFPHAKACLVHNFDGILEKLELTPWSSYLILVTRGHKSDLVVLQQALHAHVKYIGMIGSKRKILLMFEHLHAQGVPQTRLDTIHAPIGLEIGADTPEEIAVSIAAELIQVRRSND